MRAEGERLIQIIMLRDRIKAERAIRDLERMSGAELIEKDYEL